MQLSAVEPEISRIARDLPPKPPVSVAQKLKRMRAWLSRSFEPRVTQRTGGRVEHRVVAVIQ